MSKVGPLPGSSGFGHVVMSEAHTRTNSGRGTRLRLLYKATEVLTEKPTVTLTRQNSYGQDKRILSVN